MLKYCLPRCTFKQLVEDILNDSGGSGNSETFRLVADILQRIAANTASAISAFANEKKLKIDLNAEQSWELYEKCSGEKLENALANCLILFHAVYDVRSIPQIVSPEKLDELERICDAAAQLLSQFGKYTCSSFTIHQINLS
ncbi:unnamed protein product [Gongylonema pulchrum]|uniref:Uncharacterized protein n=1 Tax=Gongylonema pulchrum TaxID=637853 RepID=A0A3P7NWU5_9BILA|nr:unnamed protein product [Gongylonema pulchrum]